MNITLDDKWNITQDKYQFILCEVKTSEKGEKYFGTSHFYPRLEQLCERLFELELSDHNVQSINEVLTVLRSTRKWIDTAGFTGLDK